MIMFHYKSSLIKVTCLSLQVIFSNSNDQHICGKEAMLLRTHHVQSCL